MQETRGIELRPIRIILGDIGRIFDQPFPNGIGLRQPDGGQAAEGALVLVPCSVQRVQANPFAINYPEGS